MPFAQLPLGKTAKTFPGDQVPQHNVLIRYKGPFDWTYLYRSVQRWFEQRRFRFFETRIKDTGKKMKCDWEAKRDIDEFYSEKYDIKIEMWDLTTQEIMVNNEPRKILNGMIQFTIKGSITWDRLKLFKGSKFKEWLGKIMATVRWREMEMRGIDVTEYRTLDIQTAIKEYLNMTTKENAAW